MVDVVFSRTTIDLGMEIFGIHFSLFQVHHAGTLFLA
jgi:hypothetical protein